MFGIFSGMSSRRFDDRQHDLPPHVEVSKYLWKFLETLVV